MTGAAHQQDDGDRIAKVRRFYRESKPICVATPLYGNMVHRLYVDGLAETRDRYAGRFARVFRNGSYLPRLRDALINDFLRSNAQYMLCVDADIGWTADDVEALIATDKWFIGGCYPLKNDTGHVPVRLIDDAPPEGQLRKAQYVPAGFLLLHRAAVAAMVDHYRSEQYDSLYGKLTALWKPIGANGEDVSFCLRWREMGGDCWLHTGVRLQHVGEKTYTPDVTPLVGPKRVEVQEVGSSEEGPTDRTSELWDIALRDLPEQYPAEERDLKPSNLSDAQIVDKVRQWSLLYDPDVELPALFEAFRQTGASRFLEIGTFKGATAAAMALRFPNAEIVTLDLPDTTKSAWNAQPNEQVGIAYKALGLSDSIKQWDMPSSWLDGEGIWKREGFGRFDLIFIDGDHSEEGCYRDLVNCSKLLHDGGCLVVHDYDESPGAKSWCNDVKRAVDRFCRETNWRKERLAGWLVRLTP